VGADLAAGRAAVGPVLRGRDHVLACTEVGRPEREQERAVGGRARVRRKVERDRRRRRETLARDGYGDLRRGGGREIDGVANRRSITQLDDAVRPRRRLAGFDCSLRRRGVDAAVGVEHELDALHRERRRLRSWERKLDRVDDDLRRLLIRDPKSQDQLDLRGVGGRSRREREEDSLATLQRLDRDRQVRCTHLRSPSIEMHFGFERHHPDPA
jgi:hypothetical protein